MDAPDDHPLSFMVDAVREAGMLHLASQLADALPGTMTATGCDGNGAWHVHLFWCAAADLRLEEIELCWSPEDGFTVGDSFQCQLPDAAIAHVIELARARGEIAQVDP